MLRNFSKKILCFRFSSSLKAIKRRWARFEISFTVVNINKMIFILKLRFYERRLSSEIINLALPLIFLSLLQWNLSKCSQFVKFVLPIIFESQKDKGCRGSFLAICNFVFCSSISNLVLWIFLSTGTKKGTKFNGPANFLGNSTKWNAINLARKKPIFFFAKHYAME